MPGYRQAHSSRHQIVKAGGVHRDHPGLGGLMGSLVSLFCLSVNRKGNSSSEPARNSPALPHQLFLLLKAIGNEGREDSDR